MRRPYRKNPRAWSTPYRSTVVSIGNGLYARTAHRESLLEWYRRLQAECKHEKRDPLGTCYHCGQKEARA